MIEFLPGGENWAQLIHGSEQRYTIYQDGIFMTAFSLWSSTFSLKILDLYTIFSTSHVIIGHLYKQTSFFIVDQDQEESCWAFKFQTILHGQTLGNWDNQIKM